MLTAIGERRLQSKGVRIPVLRCLLAWQDASLCGINWPLHSSSSSPSSASGDALRSLHGNDLPGKALINASGTVVTPCYNKGDTAEERRAKERQQERQQERQRERAAKEAEAAAAAAAAAAEAAEREQAVRARAAARKRTLLISDFGDKLKGFEAHESLEEEGSEEEGEEEGGSGEEEGGEGKDGEGKRGEGKEGVERSKETNGSTNGSMNGTGAIGFDMEEEEEEDSRGRPSLPNGSNGSNGSMVDSKAAVVRSSRALLGCWEEWTGVVRRQHSWLGFQYVFIIIVYIVYMV